MKIEMTKTGVKKNVSSHVAKVLIARNLARAVDESAPVAPTYQTRMLQAEAPSAPRKTVAKKAVAKKAVARKAPAKRVTADKG